MQSCHSCTWSLHKVYNKQLLTALFEHAAIMINLLLQYKIINHIQRIYKRVLSGDNFGLIFYYLVSLWENFSYFFIKTCMLWVLMRSTSERHFSWIPTTYIFYEKLRKSYQNNHQILCRIGIQYLPYVFGQTGLSKQFRPRWDAAERGVSSGSTLFATHPAIFRHNIG